MSERLKHGGSDASAFHVHVLICSGIHFFVPEGTSSPSISITVPQQYHQSLLCAPHGVEAKLVDMLAN